LDDEPVEEEKLFGNNDPLFEEIPLNKPVPIFTPSDVEH